MSGSAPWRDRLSALRAWPVVLVGACDPEPAPACAEDLPDDFPCAMAVSSEATATCGPIPDEAPVVSAARHGGTIEVTLEGLVFREQQALCAWASLEPPSAAVLVQPCELHPAAPRKSDCLYEVVVSLPDDDALEAVHAWRRHDLHGDMPDGSALDLGSAALP